METRQDGAVIAAKQSDEWNAKHLTGDAPFTDGVEPTVSTGNVGRPPRAVISNPLRFPLRGIAQQLKRAQFTNPLSEAGTVKTKALLGLGDAKSDAEGRRLRRWCNHALLRYMRAHFYAGGGMNVLVMKPHKDASDVFRIADMARVLFWEYCKPGLTGVKYTNEDLNYSVQQVEADIEVNPDIVALLTIYKQVMLDTGAFKADPDERCTTAMKRRGEKHFRNATVMKAAEQIEAKLKDVVTNAALDEKNFLTLGALRPTQENIRALANRLTALETSHALVVDSGRGIEERFKISADNHSALESHHTTAHGVTVQRLNSIQTETAKLAGLIATLGEVMLRLENRIAQLENKSGVFYTNSPTPIAVFAGTPHQPTPDFTVTCAQKELVINPVGMG